MVQNEENKNASPGITDGKRKIWLRKLGHWGRVAVMFLSGGFIFPHALTEDMDAATHYAGKDPQVKK